MKPVVTCTEMWRQLTHPHPQRNFFAHLVPLRILSIVSSGVALLLLLSSVLCLIALNVSSDEDMVNTRQMCGFQRLKTINDFSKCEVLSRWNICSWLGIIIGFVQLAVSTLSFRRRGFERRTNIWCATHAFVFVAMAPASVLILTLPTSLQSEPAVFKSTSLKILYAAVSTTDTIFSFISVIIISLIYGLEHHPQYVLLVN